MAFKTLKLPDCAQLKNLVACSKQKIKKYLMLSLLFLLQTGLQAIPYVATFVNTTSINMHLEIHFSDETIIQKDIAMSQSYQVVNFPDKMITYVIFSSLDKDKNGNYYGQLNQKFVAPKNDVKNDVTYNLALQNIAAHTVAAAQSTDAFDMPASQAITCIVAPAESTTDIDGAKTKKDETKTTSQSKK